MIPLAKYDAIGGKTLFLGESYWNPLTRLKWETKKSGGDGSKALSDTVCKKASKGVSGPARCERKRGRAVEMALGIEGWRIQKKRSVTDLGAFWIFP